MPDLTHDDSTDDVYRVFIQMQVITTPTTGDRYHLDRHDATMPDLTPGDSYDDVIPLQVNSTTYGTNYIILMHTMPG